MHIHLRKWVSSHNFNSHKFKQHEFKVEGLEFHVQICRRMCNKTWQILSIWSIAPQGVRGKPSYQAPEAAACRPASQPASEPY